MDTGNSGVFPSIDTSYESRERTRSTAAKQSTKKQMSPIYFKKEQAYAGIFQGHSKSVLQLLPPDCINVAVTSPPYFWARDYGYEGQIGHEDTVEAFVNTLGDVFDEVKRVLHPEGVFFLNIGDTYYSGNGQPHGQDPRCSSRQFMRKKLRAVDRSGWDIPKKSMIGVPWKVAFELQRRGWTLRSDIIWNRCNAFAEPTARDRPHRQYEHIFMLTKSRFYSFDRSVLPEEDVWNIPIERNVRINHNAAFPSDLVKRCIESASPVGGKILDPFMGSGTTLDIATNLGRHAVGIDMSAKYISEVQEFFTKTGATPIEEPTFFETLRQDSPHWKSWKGNKANFRKPGTK